MNIFLLFTILVFMMACSSLTPRSVDSLSIPENGFKLVQHTIIQKDRQDNSLYKTSRRIEKHEFGTKELGNFVNKLRATMHATGGVGIAANQVNKNVQLFLIEAADNEHRHEALESIPLQTFINPKITNVSDDKRNFWHGCLSGRGEKLGNVATYDWIEFEAFDVNGQLISDRLNGFAAVIFQHEMRHLLGGTYLDKAKDYKDSAEVFVGVKEGELAYLELADDDLPLLIDDYFVGESLEEYYQRHEKY